VAGENAEAAAAPPAVSVCLEVLAKRADFLRAASARRQSTPGFLVQARDRRDDSATVRIGYTCSKKVGNAVARNRAKRRLRALARAVLPGAARPGWDYVLVGRQGVTAERPFAEMLTDFARALDKVHG
jgi:ribonuclease P protein component